MKYILLITILVASNNFRTFGQEEKESTKTIMLILGSADLETTKKRTETGYNLDTSQTEFDYIIVSGGCGAHKSSICEASEMKKYLMKKGFRAI